MEVDALSCSWCSQFMTIAHHSTIPFHAALVVRPKTKALETAAFICLVQNRNRSGTVMMTTRYIWWYHPKLSRVYIKWKSDYKLSTNIDIRYCVGTCRLSTSSKLPAVLPSHKGIQLSLVVFLWFTSVVEMISCCFFLHLRNWLSRLLKRYVQSWQLCGVLLTDPFSDNLCTACLIHFPALRFRFCQHK